MSEPTMFLKTWHGVPREEIHWNPTVVAGRCIGCGLCVTSCGRKVYQFDYENNVAVVANPLHCMVGCSTCATICPREAIEFPSRGYIQQLIRERKIVRQSKDALRADTEQYRYQGSQTSNITSVLDSFCPHPKSLSLRERDLQKEFSPLLPEGERAGDEGYPKLRLT